MKKRLLIITQKVDSSDHNLGFFVRWIEEFGKHSPAVTVICLEEGEHYFGANVTVKSLGKEEYNTQFSIFNFQSIFNVQIFKKLKYALRFLKYVWQDRRNYDAVFVHMNPEYLLLGGMLWRLFGKQVGFWYTHRSRRLLRSALSFTDFVFTPTQESFPFRTKKVRVVGHGIDAKLFAPRARGSSAHPFVILSDTRLTPSKHVERTLALSRELLKLNIAHAVRIIGATITEEDKRYETELRAQVNSEHLPISFVGGVPFALVPDYYEKADLFINHSNVGALNKTVLQAMSMNIPVLTSNESYCGVLPDEDIVPEDPALFAKKIQARLSKSCAVSYREHILREHSIEALIPKILHSYEHE